MIFDQTTMSCYALPANEPGARLVFKAREDSGRALGARGAGLEPGDPRGRGLGDHLGDVTEMVRREAERPAVLRRWGFPEGMEVREAAGAPTQIVGYAAVFGVQAHGEVIKKGAFKKSLAGGRDVRAYWQHDTRFPLGRQSNGTLKLKEDGRGLWCEITPNPETTWGRDALAAVGRGDVQGMSFGFVPVTASEKVVQGKRVVVLEEVDLFEVSAVSEPWYEATTAEARDFNAEGGLNAEGAEDAEERRGGEGEGAACGGVEEKTKAGGGAAGAAAGDKEKTEEAARAALAGASASRLARLRALEVSRLMRRVGDNGGGAARR